MRDQLMSRDIPSPKPQSRVWNRPSRHASMHAPSSPQFGRQLRFAVPSRLMQGIENRLVHSTSTAAQHIYHTSAGRGSWGRGTGRRMTGFACRTSWVGMLAQRRLPEEARSFFSTHFAVLLPFLSQRACCAEAQADGLSAMMCCLQATTWLC